MKLRPALEAILFVAESPIPEGELAEVLERPTDEVSTELIAWAERLEVEDRGITLRNVGGGWRFYTKPEALPYLERFSTTATASRLSNAALEVLAVVAYRQPVSRGQIGELRGVDSETATRTLERRGLIEEAGRLTTPGNPAIYQTTKAFLEHLGLKSLADLPPLADHVPPAEVVESLEGALMLGGDASDSGPVRENSESDVDA
jgi:segregation and condensation protein B